MGAPSRKGADGRIQPGEIRNPDGRNQYSYRRDFGRTVVQLLEGGLKELEFDGLPEWTRELISHAMTSGEVIAVITVCGALRGDEKQLLELLKRVWPSPAAPRPPENVPEEPPPWRERREGMELEKILPPELMAQLRFEVGQSLMGGGNIDPDPDKERTK